MTMEPAWEPRQQPAQLEGAAVQAGAKRTGAEKGSTRRRKNGTRRRKAQLVKNRQQKVRTFSCRGGREFSQQTLEGCLFFADGLEGAGLVVGGASGGDKVLQLGHTSLSLGNLTSGILPFSHGAGALVEASVDGTGDADTGDAGVEAGAEAGAATGSEAGGDAGFEAGVEGAGDTRGGSGDGEREREAAESAKDGKREGEGLLAVCASVKSTSNPTVGSSSPLSSLYSAETWSTARHQVDNVKACWSNGVRPAAGEEGWEDARRRTSQMVLGECRVAEEEPAVSARAVWGTKEAQEIRLRFSTLEERHGRQPRAAERAPQWPEAAETARQVDEGGGGGTAGGRRRRRRRQVAEGGGDGAAVAGGGAVGGERRGERMEAAQMARQAAEGGGEGTARGWRRRPAHRRGRFDGLIKAKSLQALPRAHGYKVGTGDTGAPESVSVITGQSVKRALQRAL
ncbi:MAG: hypothetical protein BJ554DRAFT_214 [Olpidium bornovanus]|uniref:Uncharacterized protein n=1 Tax=Olpidium bornovanus TaxID=278681 RepID=A0A8H8DI12_9FUNG|nr:MAG: hypothetical protein BJ554DRAFT_214 [Olpidium bornovanus]